MARIEFTISDIVELIYRRRNNKQDARIVITGNTGKAKSTCASKILFRIDGFDPWKHQVYNRKEAIDLIMQNKSICWDDEAIETLYNRGFHSPEQQDYIRKIIKNRDHYNIIITVLPRFEYLDKHVKPLYFMHIMMIHRPELDEHGNQVDPNDTAVGLVFTPKPYGKDPWRVDAEEKIMKRWDELSQKNPNFKPPYHKLPTFTGVLRFNDITKKQREIVDLVKKTKKNSEEGEDEEVEKKFIDKVYEQLLKGNISKIGLQEQCLTQGKKFSSICISLNRMLKDRGEDKTVKNLFKDSKSNKVTDKEEKLREIFGDG